MMSYSRITWSSLSFAGEYDLLRLRGLCEMHNRAAGSNFYVVTVSLGRASALRGHIHNRRLISLRSARRNAPLPNVASQSFAKGNWIGAARNRYPLTVIVVITVINAN